MLENRLLFILNQSTQDWHSGSLRKAGLMELSATRVYQCHVVRFSLLVKDLCPPGRA
jgi:hypothetical protein